MYVPKKNNETKMKRTDQKKEKGKNGKKNASQERSIT